MKHPSRQYITAALLGFITGVICLMVLRFVMYKPKITHYHANFAVYINGQQEKFDNFTFYEEVQSCGSDELNNPKTRVHMHDNVNSVAHVHDNAATWGHFFANLGLTLGNNVLRTDNSLLADDNTNKLTFILNGRETENVANQTIKSEDRLLVSYGNEAPGNIQKRFADIKHDAAEYNKRDDPSTCAGSKPVTLLDRLKHATRLSN